MSNFWDELMLDDEHAADYMLSYGEGPGCETRMVLNEFVTPEDSVLDVGCGPGWNLEHFLDYGPKIRRYKGVDYSERFVKVANERRKQEEIPTTYALPFEVQDCRDLKEQDNSWDVVIIQDCLEHTNGYEKPIKEAIRVTRKRVVVAFWHLTANDDHINNDGNDGYGAWYSRPKWEYFLNRLGYNWETKQIIDPKGKPRDFYVIYKEIE